MTPTTTWLLRAPIALAAASITLGAAQACGPMAPGGGGDSSQPSAPAQVGPAQSAPAQGSGSQGGSGQDGGGRGWDGAGAQSMQQGADAAARSDLGDDSDGPRRSSSDAGVQGAASADYTNQIAAVGAAEASASQAAASDDDQSWVEARQKQWDESQTQRLLRPSQWNAPTGGFKGWWWMIFGDPAPAQSSEPAPPPSAAYNDDRINPEWKAYIDLPWYQQLWVPTPHMWRPGFEPGQPTTTASVRG
jgi:hypothetical protein